MNNFLHPHVASQIIDNTEIVTVTPSDLTLFACLTADQGEDNKVITVYSQTDYISKFGAPNFSKHGQAAYNVMNWLKAGGNAKIIRVTPSDSGYANLFLSVQTKYEYDEAGKVTKANLRPAFLYSNSNGSLAGLTNELNIAETTIDGYKENVLLGFYPVGRGKTYNNLAVSLTLNDKYIDTYSFRLYDLTFYNVSEKGDLSVLETYIVSLSPEAINNGGESMFIQTVVERNSVVFKVLFNKEAYNKIGNDINPYVNVSTLDLITGVQNTLYGEDVTYVVPGTSDLIKTHSKIALANKDEISKSYIELDNTSRTKNVEIAKNKLAIATDNVRRIARNTFLTNFDSDILKVKDKTPVVTTGLTTLMASIKAFNEAAANLKRTSIVGDISNVTEKAIKANPIYTSLGDNATNVKTLVEDYLNLFKNVVYDINAIQRVELGTPLRKLGNQAEIVSTLSLKKESKVVLMSLVAKTIKTLVESESATSASEVTAVLGTLEESLALISSLNASIVLQYQEEVDGENVVQTVDNHSAYITLIQAEFDKIKVAFNKVITDRFSEDSEKQQAIVDAVGDLRGVLTLCNEYLAIIELFINVDYVLDIAVISGENVATIGSAAEAQADAIINADKRAFIVSEAGKAELIAEEGRAVIYVDEAEGEYQKVGALDYILAYDDFSKAASFEKGTDGSIDYTPTNIANRRAIINGLLIAGYSGLIDSSIIDSKIVKFSDMMDAAYAPPVKKAMIQLASEVRKDCFVFLDSGTKNLTADETVMYRRTNAQFNTSYAALYGQSLMVEDALFSKNDIEVTPTFFLSTKVPVLELSGGIHFPIAGIRRGTLDGVKAIKFNPNTLQKESLYREQINYIEQDPKNIKFATQNTTQKKSSALSKISNVRTTLKIKSEVEDLMQNYLQEFNDSTVIGAANAALSSYLSEYLKKSMVSAISGSVYASEQEAKEGLLRVKIEITFKNIIERIAIDIVIK